MDRRGAQGALGPGIDIAIFIRILRLVLNDENCGYVLLSYASAYSGVDHIFDPLRLHFLVPSTFSLLCYLQHYLIPHSYSNSVTINHRYPFFPLPYARDK